MTWEHKPDRTPQLDRLDLQTIELLVREYGKKHIPLYSERLMKKVRESMKAYQFEDELLKKARKENEDENT